MEVVSGAWSLLFSLPWLNNTALYLHSLPFSPVFSSVHYLLTAFALRKEPGSVEFAMDHPVASCVMTFVVASSGGILANLMTGAPPLECVADGWCVAMAIISWYLIFLSPLDIFYYLTSSLPAQLSLFTFEEVARAKKILSGVTAASYLYPQSVTAMAIVGLVKGSGKQWGITCYRLVHWPQTASVMELKKISLITKIATVFGLAFALNSQHGFCSQHQLMMAASILLVIFRHKSLLKSETDFFDPFLGTVWWLATYLVVRPPARDHQTASGSPDEAESNSKVEIVGKNKVKN